MKKKILVVDNHPVMLRLMTILLEKHGHEVVTAEDGLIALNKLRTFIPDFIFVDLVMPNISGERLCRIIRKMPSLRHVYLIIVSGIAAEGNFDYAEIGADACIAKGPFQKVGEHVLAILNQPNKELTIDDKRKIHGLEDVYKREITKELVDTRAHFEVIIQNMGEGILELTQNDTIVYANPTALKVLDMAEENVVAAKFSDLFSPKQAEQISLLRQPANKQPISMSYDNPIYIQEKEIILRFFPVHDEKKKSEIVIINDITEQKLAERALRESEQKFKSAFNNAAVGMALTNISGDILMANAYLSEMLGYFEDDLIAKNMNDITYPDDIDLDKYYHQEIRSGHSVCQWIDKRYVHKDGHLVWGRISSSFLQDASSKPLYFVSHIQNVTELKRAEQSLMEEYAFRRAVIARAAEGLCVFQSISEFPYVKFTVWNERMTEITGYNIQSVNAEGFFHILFEKDNNKAQAQAKLADIQKGNNLYGEEWEITRSDNQKRIISISTSLLQMGHKNKHVLAMMHDITARKKAEDALQALHKELEHRVEKRTEELWKVNQELQKAKIAAEAAAMAKGNFLANVSHELKTPMNHILAAADLTLGSSDPQEIKKYVSTIQSSADSLLKVINDIIDFSKLDQAAIELAPEEFMIPQVLQQIDDKFKTRFMAKKFAVSYTIAPQVPVYLVGDIDRLNQVLDNLLDNAIKFTPKNGKIDISISMMDQTFDHTVLKFGVADTGIGISPEQITFLFDPFNQADGSSTRKFDGIGLGLSISKKLVEMMDGKIDVDSTPGQGSRFSFTANFNFSLDKPNNETMVSYMDQIPHETAQPIEQKIAETLVEPQIEPEALPETINHLIAALETADPEKISRILQKVHRHLSQTLIQELETLILDYDYQEAVELILTYAKENNINL